MVKFCQQFPLLQTASLTDGIELTDSRSNIPIDTISVIVCRNKGQFKP
jgi:hypothetical protein